MVVAKPDEKAPDKEKWPKGSLLAKMKKTWPELHKGVKYGVKLPVNISIKDWVLCILHMNLRIVGNLFQHTVVDRVGHCPRDKNHDQAQELYDLLQKLCVWIKLTKLKKKSNKVEQKFEHCISFGGEAAESLMSAYPAMLDIIYPPSKRRVMENGKDNKVLEQYKRAADAWGKWAHTWGLLDNKAQQGDLLAH
jgi:hypothetical protein